MGLRPRHHAAAAFAAYWDPPPHRREGIAWERGRPARTLSLWPPLSFSAVLQAATLSAGTAAAKPKQSHGPVPD